MLHTFHVQNRAISQQWMLWASLKGEPAGRHSLHQVSRLMSVFLCAAAAGGRQGCKAPPDSEDLGLRRQQAQGLCLLQCAKCWRWVCPGEAEGAPLPAMAGHGIPDEAPPPAIAGHGTLAQWWHGCTACAVALGADCMPSMIAAHSSALHARCCPTRVRDATSQWVHE